MSETAAQYSEEETEIPDTVYVNCPLHGDDYPLVQVQKYCVGCPHWQGFFRQDYKHVKDRVAQEIPFAKEHSIKCGLPVPRQLVEVIN